MVITATGLYFLFSSCYILKQSHDGLNWPQTKGHIVSSLLTIDHLPPWIDWNTDQIRWYGISVEYEYTVDYIPYSSHRLWFQKWYFRNPKPALNIMNKYRRSQEAAVYYDPANPGEAVLDPGYLGYIFIPMIIGTFLVICGTFTLLSKSLEIHRGMDSYITQGNIYLEQQKWPDALIEYNQAIAREPHAALGYSSRGTLYLHCKDWDQAILNYQKALAVNPRDGLVYFALAQAYLGKKNYDKAWENLHKAMNNGFRVKSEILESVKNKL